MALSVPTDPAHVCYQHPCDRCAECEAGSCCGEAVVDANLPPLGSWPTPPQAPLGELVETDSGALVCHACGEAHEALWAHIRRHRINAHEYRSIFGLAVSTPLASRRLREMRPGRSDASQNIAAFVEEATPEMRSAWARNREARLQTQQRSGFANSNVQRARAQARVAQHTVDPAAHQQWRKRIIKARRARKDDPGRRCVSCGVEFCQVPDRRRSKRLTCGQSECITAAKRKAQAASQAARSS